MTSLESDHAKRSPLNILDAAFLVAAAAGLSVSASQKAQQS